MIDKGKTSSFGIGLLAGTAIGLTLGVLYAPHRGTVTRELIKEKVEDTKAKAEEIVEKAKKEAEEIVEKAKEKLPG
jgi:gas vesicle protein